MDDDYEIYAYKKLRLLKKIKIKIKIKIKYNKK